MTCCFSGDDKDVVSRCEAYAARIASIGPVFGVMETTPASPGSVAFGPLI